MFNLVIKSKALEPNFKLDGYWSKISLNNSLKSYKNYLTNSQDKENYNSNKTRLELKLGKNWNGDHPNVFPILEFN